MLDRRRKMRKIGVRVMVLVILFLASAGLSGMQGCSENTFKETSSGNASTESEEYYSGLEENIITGGVGKDGIPPIESPLYNGIDEADEWLLPNDVVFGVDYKGLVAAYPQRIMVWHEIVNEEVGGELISISYCPLTGTAIGYFGDLKDDIQSTFGVSGDLVNSNLIMYDRATESYWPQILGASIRGDMKGSRLSQFRVIWTTWQDWKDSFSDGKVLSRDTGFNRNYDFDPYGSYVTSSKGYYSSENLRIPVPHKDDRLANKTVVIGIRDEDNNAVAIVKDYLRDHKEIEVRLGKDIIRVSYVENLDTHIAEVKGSGEWKNSFDAMWFSWVAYYPDTQLVY